jgi:hypothetical protein
MFFKKKEKVITDTYSQYGIPGEYFSQSQCRLKIVIDPPKSYFGYKLKKDRRNYDLLLLIHGAETPDINDIKNEVLEYGALFDKICSFDDDVNKAFKHSELFCFGSCWVLTNQFKQSTPLKSDYVSHFNLKNKFKVSFIRSNKKELPGHKLRYDLENIITNDYSFELYFPQQRIESKIPLFEDSMYHITIENSRYNNYITEKIIDCFMSYTVPIYWGCPNIGDYFDMNGVITFETKEELTHVLNNLTPKFYEDNINAIQHNYEVAKNNFAFFFDRVNDVIKTMVK